MRGRRAVVRRRAAPLLVAGALALGLPGGARGQDVVGHALDEATALPVQGALVELLRADSSRVRATLSDAEGRFVIAASRHGTFILRARRIGYATFVSEPFEVTGSGVAVLRLLLPSRPVPLAGFVAEGTARCVSDPEEGAATAALWDEARKVLEVTAHMHRERVLRYEVVRFARSLDRSGDRLVEERIQRGFLDASFRSPPAEALARSGFVVPEEDGSRVYYMPDPTVVLSDGFLDTHCFRVRPGAAGASLVGLAFEPLPKVETPDVEGVLWLDAGSGALRFMEYGYRGLGSDRADEVSGGRAEFEQLATGAWVVRRWYIRMPILQQRRAFLGLGGRPRVRGLREEGGEILQAFDRDGSMVTLPGDARLSGVVHDSTRGEPLAGALVRVAGTLRSVETDSLGAFAFGGLPAGHHAVSVHHARLDTLGILPPLRRVTVASGGGARLALALPSRRTIEKGFCPRARPGRGILTVQVTDAQDEPVPGITVKVSYARGRQLAGGGPTDARGEVRICGLSRGERMVVQALQEDREGPEVEASLPEDGFGRVELRLPEEPSRG